MRYFLYRMQSTDAVPGGGDFRGWLHFYKWGRPETVTFRKRAPHLEGLQKGDVLFFVLDGFLIGDALVDAVRDDVHIEGHYQPVQEIDIAEKGIWEYRRSWGLWDKYLDRLRLVGLKDEVPSERAHGWLQAYRPEMGWIDGVVPYVKPSTKGRVAVFDPAVLPPFFGIKKKVALSF